MNKDLIFTATEILEEFVSSYSEADKNKLVKTLQKVEYDGANIIVRKIREYFEDNSVDTRYYLLNLDKFIDFLDNILFNIFSEGISNNE